MIMKRLPPSVAHFLESRRIAVAGVSRDKNQAANFVFRKLQDAGFETVPINPQAEEVEGVACYPDIASIPEPVDGVVIATHPDVSAQVVDQCAEAGIDRVWFHRSFGAGSVS